MIEQSEPAPPKKQDSKVVLGFATVGMFVGAAALRAVGADYYQAVSACLRFTARCET